MNNLNHFSKCWNERKFDFNNMTEELSRVYFETKSILNNFEYVENQVKNKLGDLKGVKGILEKKYIWKFNKKGLEGTLCQQKVYCLLFEEPPSTFSRFCYDGNSWEVVEDEVIVSDEEPSDEEIKSSILEEMMSDIRKNLHKCSEVYKTELNEEHIKDPSFFNTIYNLNDPTSKLMFYKNFLKSQKERVSEQLHEPRYLNNNTVCEFSSF